MAEVRINPEEPTAEPSGDVEMAGGDDDVVEIGESAVAQPAAEGEEPQAVAGEEEEKKPAPRVTFVECATLLLYASFSEE